MRIICLSGKAGHGKDTVASIMRKQLEDMGKRVLVTHFADLVKYVCEKFFDWDGKKDEVGRAILQTVGTDVVRAYDNNYWVNFLVQIFTMFPDEWDVVLIPDCRFPNEYEVLKQEGFNTVLVRVTRPGYISSLTEEQKQHPSETALDNYNWDMEIFNSCDINVLDKVIWPATILLGDEDSSFSGIEMMSG